MLARVGLDDRADERVKRYSQGMRQRLGVARALLADPELLILDEPTNGLDPAGMLEFRAMIRDLVETEGRTVLLSSHLLAEVERICDQVAIVDRGRVVSQGTIAELGRGEQGLAIATSDDEEALAILSCHRAVATIDLDGDGIRVGLLPDVDAEAAGDDIGRRLIDGGVSIRRFERTRPSLEERFLEVTS